MKNSIIQHPAQDNFIMIRKWYQDLVPDRKGERKVNKGCAAALMSLFEFWYNANLNGNRNLESTVSFKEISESLQGLFGRNTIIKAIDFLVEFKILFVSSETQTGKRSYLFNHEKVNNLSKKLSLKKDEVSLKKDEVSLNLNEVSLKKDYIYKDNIKDNIKEYIVQSSNNSNEPKHKEEIIEVINFLNEKASVNFRTNGVENSKLINARLNQGYTVDDFKKVILNKVKEWSGTKLEKFLRPSTLFNVNKFENYVNEKTHEPVEIEEDDFQLNEAQEAVYQNWIEEGNQKYPALVNSKTTYLTRRHLTELMIYANKPTTRIEFTIKDFKIFMQKCFKELNDFKYKRDAYINSYNYIIDEARKEINR